MTTKLDDGGLTLFVSVIILIMVAVITYQSLPIQIAFCFLGLFAFLLAMHTEQMHNLEHWLKGYN